jgi:hypothetical protein
MIGGKPLEVLWLLGAAGQGPAVAQPTTTLILVA